MFIFILYDDLNLVDNMVYVYFNQENFKLFKYLIYVFYRLDGIGIVLLKEKLQFDEIKERLRILLENQIILNCNFFFSKIVFMSFGLQKV